MSAGELLWSLKLGLLKTRRRQTLPRDPRRRDFPSNAFADSAFSGEEPRLLQLLAALLAKGRQLPQKALH